MDSIAEADSISIKKVSIARLFGSIVLGVILTLFLCWIVAPLISFYTGTVFSLMKGEQLMAEISSTILAIDLVYSFSFVMVSCYLAILLSRANPFLVALPIGIIGCLVYLAEVGWFSGMMASDYPLWYNISGLFQDILATLLTAILFRRVENILV